MARIDEFAPQMVQLHTQTQYHPLPSTTPFKIQEPNNTQFRIQPTEREACALANDDMKFR
ncbi:unnamed protein product [Camellia sinensis]